MTSPLDSYTASMDSLHFSDEAKVRMAESLRAAAAAKNAEKNAQSAAPVEVLTVSARRPARPRASRWARVAAGLALALALGGGATVAVAAGVLPNPADVLSDVFGGAPAQTELLNEVGRPIGASATSNGVTVTAEAVAGDRFNYAVAYSIEFEDSAALEGIEFHEGGTLTYVGDAFLRVDGAMSGGGLVRLYDADPGDNTLQLVQVMGVQTWNDAGIVGRTARFSMSKLEIFTDEGEFKTLAAGDWNLKFEMNYVDTTVDLPASQTTTWQGSDVTIDAVAVSSLGVTVDYTIDRQTRDLALPGEVSEEALAEQAAVTGLPVIVTFADGTTFDATDANGSSTKRSDGTTTVSKATIYDHIVDTDDIVSVTVGDVEIPVNAA
ncbi:DUF4179 domain-containing protein [Olsenella sp. An290]|uniref:DUF4179 domain-containing protein n=1 Tax=Olsenella sp. An290 TaxID=1965625 RepID=UPI000B37D7D5|nr:DUF4179 domain-containing protein [Olsenella sp. An290]OUO35952.1 hypothetical protein B5F84_01175 [Olsenella sp. An290]